MGINYDKIKIAGTEYDKRRKLSESEREEIRILLEEGHSQRSLAKKYGVSRGTIQNIIRPNRYRRAKKYSSEYWAEAKKRCRQHKQGLLKSGQIYANRQKAK